MRNNKFIYLIVIMSPVFLFLLNKLVVFPYMKSNFNIKAKT